MVNSTTEDKNVIYGLYCVCEKCDDRREGIRYVGQTTQGASRRFKGHLSVLNDSSTDRERLRRLPLYRWIGKHGVRNIRYKQLGRFDTPDPLNESERSWITKLETADQSKGGLNLTPGGVGSRGYLHTQEAKTKMRENFKSRERRMKSSHPGEKHPLATFTEAEVSTIKRRLWSGEGNTRVAKDLGVPVHRIQQINVDASWQHVPWPIGPRVKQPYRSRLSKDGVLRAKELRSQGVSYRGIAEELDVSVTCVFRTVNG